MTRPDMLIVPWGADFIEALAELLASRGEALGDVRVVFPHNRPARHLRAALAARADLPRPCLLPRMQSLDEFLRELRRELSPEPPLRAGQLDRVGVLHDIVRELALTDGPLAALCGSAREFFPWGARLASLLEEMAGQDVRPAAIRNLQGEVTPWAEALLARLDSIGEAYHAELSRRGWSTPALDSLWLRRNVEQAAAHLAGQPLLFAGLHALSASEEPLLRRLWDDGACFAWHTDPALAQGTDPAWPAREHARWLARWGARAALAAQPPEAAPQDKPQVRRFYEGFDLHSQLHALERELAALPDTARTAVVLPDPGALVPVLHHLPAAETNISMGYPLERSSLAQLVETILRLHENAALRPDGPRYAWRDLVALVRHPLLRMLRPEGCEDTPLRAAYVAFERHIRSGGAYQSPREWLFACETAEGSAPEDAARALHEEVLTACFDAFQGLRTLRQTGQALGGLCELLRRRGGDLWRRNLIDAECLLRLWQSVTPELTGSILADEDYGRDLSFLVLRHLVRSERVSFEPEPLAGLQVLGMLETRLLSFTRLFILDATEDKLPGAASPDPLLPEPLRQALGLPGRRERDNVAAHNFYRLLMGAGEVTVLYQAGVRPGTLEGKSERSRYVEQLLWELERRQGALVKPRPLHEADAPLRSVVFPVRPIAPKERRVDMTNALRQRLRERLARQGVTPSGLEQWLSCPRRAFYAQVLGLRPMQEVAEDGDRARFGELVHRVLKDFLAPWLDKPLAPGSLDAAVLCADFERALAAEDFSGQLPYDTRAVLLAAGRERLRRFVDHVPPTTVRALELPVLTALELPGMEGAAQVRLHGRIDRVDERGGLLHVLDYKTGGVKEGGAAAWLDEGLFGEMSGCSPGSPEADALFLRLAQDAPDVQLPAYMHLLEASGAGAAANAAWVRLKGDGAELALFGPDVAPEVREMVVRERVPALLRFVLGHVLAAPALPALAGRQCDWCNFKGPCGA